MIIETPRISWAVISKTGRTIPCVNLAGSVLTFWYWTDLSALLWVIQLLESWILKTSECRKAFIDWDSLDLK